MEMERSHRAHGCWTIISKVSEEENVWHNFGRTKGPNYLKLGPDLGMSQSTVHVGV